MVAGTRQQTDRKIDPDDDEEVEPDIPDEWIDCSEDREDLLNERFYAEGWPVI